MTTEDFILWVGIGWLAIGLALCELTKSRGFFADLAFCITWPILAVWFLWERRRR